MIFSSLTFLIFFGIVLLLMWKLRTDRQKHWMLLIASWVFYGAWDWRFLSLIWASSLWSWYFGRKIARSDDDRRRRIYLATTLTLDLSLLGVFKYADFFIGSFAALFQIERVDSLHITLPVGISFFTFQTMSYTIDIYRRKLDECDDVVRFLLFVAFFPQLVAGPIVRAAEFLPQLKNPVRLTMANLSRGSQIFVLGLFQKTLVADNLASFVDPVFAKPELWSASTLWAGLGAYSLQIFCDFSGYSLMAIGVGRVLGFHLPENFRTPYRSRSITEFWRRWHISLSSWLRDYLYISLGGNRQGPRRTDFNLMATMVLGGLWHGAGWNFVIWGAMHGLGLMVHKHWRRLVGTHRLTGPVGAAWSSFSWLLTLLYACMLWIPFRAQTFQATRVYVARMFTGADGVVWLQTGSMMLLALMTVWHIVHAHPRVQRLLPAHRAMDPVPLGLLGAMVLLVFMFAPLEASPFIYFQF